ncbi:PEP/pyruvate-binding domain-containing protein [Gordonia polyisoprenivorans]|uniref:PEP/pyruvate-binding domain-containing protein n=1 Tax=Gordonia polyisoprenivorans TaxID=84595 RepID=UPI000B99D765|nr:PEP/pyruvate-binding domain-containing protein [Gordonia polyisoprenivorans]OZC29698.1 phosphoenolpyruvate synthase [Gordonia polyisoprenivorans]
MIRRLEPQLSADIDEIGGKALGLVRLLRAGLTVPEAWVIPAEVSADDGLQQRCAHELARWWARVNAEYPGARWAVRSSAVAEDLDGASFAGVYDTILGVADQAELDAAIAQCWRAHGADRAVVYRDDRDLDGAGGIAVVLQRMLEPRCAGVMLTANPHRPFAHEIVVDASWGLGEAIVSGKVDPDHVVLDQVTGSVREHRVAHKKTETVYDGGLVDRPVPSDRAEAACLNDPDLAALHATARQVESAIGPARDIEWALCDGSLYVLQDRPITSLPSAAPDNVWSRRWGDEYKSEYSLPLSSAVMGAWMDIPMFVELPRLQRRRDLAVREPFKFFNGYMYMDGTYAASMARALPKGKRGTIFGAWFTPLWMSRIEQERWNPRLTLEMARSLRRDPDRGGQRANLEAMRAHCRRIEEHIAPKLSQDYRALGDEEWRRQFDELETFGLEHFRIIRWGMGMHNTLLHQVLADLLGQWCSDDDGELYRSVIGGLPGTRTAQINAEICELARVVRADEPFAARFVECENVDRLRETDPCATVWAELDAFLARHGHRAASRDIAAARWSEEPDVVLGLVRAQVRAGAGNAGTGENTAAAARVSATDTALHCAARGPLGGVRRAVLQTVIERTQEFTVYRENQRYHLDYLIAHARALVSEQARRLVEAGRLDAIDDVYYLTAPEFWACVSPWPDLRVPVDRDAIRSRRQNHLTYRNRMPATYLFDDIETEGEIADGDRPDGTGDGEISGIGASRGRARGRTRCVEDISGLAAVQPGDILVAKNIDPAWTSVFPLLGGLITETGGVLSHGAILAREYGIPTVTGVADAVSLLGDGTLVDVDGGAGAVRLAHAEVLDAAH